MANFFTNLKNKLGFKKKTDEKPMAFAVGEGLSAAQTERAQQVISKPSGVDTLGSGNFFKNLINDAVPGTLRYPARAATSVLSDVEFQPRTNFERFALGDEAVKPIAQSFADSELKYQDRGFGKFSGLAAGATVIGSTTLDLLPGSKKSLTKVEERAIIKNLNKALPELHNAVNTTGKIDDWAEAADIMKRIDQGKESYADFKRAQEILENHKQTTTGFATKSVPDITNTQAGFAKVPTPEEIRETSQKVRTQFIDQYSPLYDLTKNKLAADVDPYVAARNFAGHYGKVQNRLDDLSEILAPVRDILDDFNEYAKLERFAELSRNGITKFENGLTPAGIATKKNQLIDKLGFDNVVRIENQLEQLYTYQDEILEYYANSGMLSQDSLMNIRLKGQKYVPLQAIEYLDEQFDNIAKGANAFSVSEQNLVKYIEGNEKAVANTLESVVRNTYRAVNTAERNLVAQKLAQLSALPEFKGLISKVTDSVPQGYGKFSVFMDGVKHEYAAPQVIVDVMKNLNAQNVDFITKLASKGSALLRAGATTLNAAFIPTNAIRDFQSALLVSKVGFNPADWIRGFAEAWRKGDDYKTFLESGGSFAGFFERNRSMAKTVKKLTEKKSITALKTLANPFEMIRAIGEKIELAPRLGVFKRALRKGKSQTEAGFIARNATVDFAKSGSAMKVVNMWVPFINARTQGVLNMFSAVKTNPGRSALILGGLVGVPTVATYIHNSKAYPEIWNDIAQFEKDNNILVIYGDKRDADGNPTQVLKIPKSDAAKVFGNPLEEFLAFMDGNSETSIQDVALQMFSDISPVSFAQEGDLSPRTAISGVLPPTAKAVVEGTTNTNLFTGAPIVPRSLEGASPENQYKTSTSPIYIKLGAFLKVSPLVLENSFRTQFGGLAGQVVDPTRIGSDVSKRFSGAKGGQSDRDDFSELDRTEQAYVDERVNAKRTAENFYNELIALPPHERQAKAQELAGKGMLTKAVLDQLDVLLTKHTEGLSSFEEVLRNKPIDVRAAMLADKLKTLPIEERQKLFMEWSEKKIITPEVLKALIKHLQK